MSRPTLQLFFTAVSYPCPPEIMQLIPNALRYQKLRQSIGLVATSTAASIIIKNKDFMQELWNSKLEPSSDGYFDPYYDA